MFLRIRRLPDDRHRFIFIAPYLFGWLLGIYLIGVAHGPLYDRHLDLFRADLSKKDLRSAYLKKANLVEADLNGSDLQEAALYQANLRGANLDGVNLEKANIWGGNLEHANLRGANLQETYIPSANFREANLREANLRLAYLGGANLGGANLQEADLGGANIRGARELTVEQLCKASTLYKAKLDQELESQVNQKCPDLLKEPQKNNPDEKK